MDPIVKYLKHGLKNINSLLSLSLTVCVLLLTGVSPVIAQPDQVTVVLNSAQPVALSRQHITDIFFGRSSQLPNGQPISPVILRGQNPAHSVFARKVLERSPLQFRSFWAKQLFTGRGKPPIQVESLAEMQALISSKPGYIGYVLNEQLSPGLYASFSAR